MKALFLASAVLITALPALAQTPQYNNGYTRRDGSYVAPHYSTRPDSTPYNNYSTQGNTNPYTGQRGYVNPTPSYGTRQPSYGSTTRRGW